MRDRVGNATTRQAAAALAVVVLVLGAAIVPGTASPASAQVDRFTPLVQSVVSTPRWFKAVDGRFHLVYELELVNGTPVPVTVTSLTVRDRARARAVKTLRGPALLASMSLLPGPTHATTTGTAFR
jgi:hypothetical protein